MVGNIEVMTPNSYSNGSILLPNVSGLEEKLVDFLENQMMMY